MVTKGILKSAHLLLDRFLRDAEGRTNQQLDVYFTIDDLGLAKDKAEASMEFLVSRGLINAFGPEIAFLTELGVKAAIEDQDLSKLPKVYKDFNQVPTSSPASAPTQPASGPQPSGATLIHIDLNGQQFTLPLAELCTIGRAEHNDVRVNDQRASKAHAEVRRERGGYVLVDLESANGTLLNGNYCVAPTTLKHDDEIVIGRTMLLFQDQQSVQAAPAGQASLPPARGEVRVSGLGPTERPAPATPELAAPDIKVVKGTPALPEEPQDLFVSSDSETAAEKPIDLFAESQESKASEEEAEGSLEDTHIPNFSLDEVQEEKTDPPAPVGADQDPQDLFLDPSPPTSSAKVEAAPLPSSSAPEVKAQMPMEESDGVTMPFDQEEPIDLPDANIAPLTPEDLLAPSPWEASQGIADVDVATPFVPIQEALTSSPAVEPLPSEELDESATVTITGDELFGEDTPAEATMTVEIAPESVEEKAPIPRVDSVEVDAAESLPLASPSMVDLKAPTAEQIAAGPEPEVSAFLKELRTLKENVLRDKPEGMETLLAAIDLLDDHAYVRLATRRSADPTD